MGEAEDMMRYCDYEWWQEQEGATGRLRLAEMFPW